MSLPDEPPAKPSLRWAYAAMAFNLVAWGMSWVNVRAIVREVGPGELGAMRYLIASAVITTIWLARGRPLPAARDVPAVALLGLCGFTLYNLGINYGEVTVDAGTGAMLISCVPVLVMVVGVALGRERVTGWGWTGFLIAMTGVGFTSGVLENGVTLNLGTLLILGSALCATAQTLLSKALTRRYAAVDVTTWAIWFGTLGLLPFAHGIGEVATRLSPGAWGHLIFLGVVPAALCYSLWAWVLQTLPMTLVMGSVYVMPLFSVLFGALVLGETPPTAALGGGLLTLIGVALIQRLGRPRA
jgi:drug/metabolite transporter (DMT)-like permease